MHVSNKTAMIMSSQKAKLIIYNNKIKRYLFLK